MDALRQDLRYAVRTLIKSPAFALVAIATLGLGIGANSAVFSALSSIVLSPLPGVGTERLVAIYSQDDHADFPHELTYPDLTALRRGTAAFDGLAGRRFILAGVASEGQSVQVAGELVTANFFQVLGLDPFLGRAFRPEEETEGGEPVVVISHGLFERHFGGDEAVVGSEIVLNGRTVRVVGVTPRGFTGSRFPVRFDVWIPMAFHDVARPELAGFDWQNGRFGHWLEVIGRLREGVSLEEARAEVDFVMQQRQAEFPDSNQRVEALTLYERDARISASHPEATSLGGLLSMGLVGLVLLVACANVANLVLARATGRSREVGVRLALGASRLRLVRQLLTENLLLALAGGVLGWLLAVWVSKLLVGLMPARAVAFALDFTPGLEVLAFTASLTVLSVLLFGLVPAMGASRGDLVPLLKGEAPGSRRRRRPTLRGALTVVQVSMSLVLLVAAGLFIRSLGHAKRIDPGFQPAGLVLFDFNVALLDYPEARGRNFFSGLEERVRAIPGVESVGSSYIVPLSGRNRSLNITIDERPLNPEGGGVGVACNMVGPGFFKTLGVDLLRGREFTLDDREEAPRVVVVNAALADWLWPEEDPIGKRIRLAGPPDPAFEVVGLVRTGKYRTLGEDPLPFLYFSRLQRYDPSLTLNVRYAGDPHALVARVRDEVRSLDPNLPINHVRTMDEHRRVSLLLPQLSATLATSLGAIALLLAAVGLYGVMATAVAGRRREIGVRMALGARRGRVLGLILAQGLRVTLVGLAIGLLASLATSRLFGGFLYGVAPLDALTFLLVPLSLLGVATLACLVPARRAAQVDPLEVLRCE